MPTCSNCDSPIVDGRRCENCGYLSQTEASKKKEEKAKRKLLQDDEPEEEFNPQELSDKLHWIFKKYEVEDTTSMYDIEERQKNKGMALLSYLGILVLIPWFAKRGEKYIQFHVKQGINLFILWIISVVVVNFLSGALRGTIPVGVFDILNILVNTFFAIIMIVGIFNVLMEKAKALPIIGKIKIIK